MYFWTAEIQPKRLSIKGEKVLHWHVIFAFQDIRFGAEDVKRIQQYWKYGQVEIIPVYNKPSMAYLLKYTEKMAEEFHEDYDNIRRFGSSFIEAFYRQPRKAYLKAKAYFEEWMHRLGAKMEHFWWSNGDAFYYEDLDSPVYLDSRTIRRKRVYVYQREREWEWMGVVCEPF